MSPPKHKDNNNQTISYQTQTKQPTQPRQPRPLPPLPLHTTTTTTHYTLHTHYYYYYTHTYPPSPSAPSLIHLSPSPAHNNRTHEPHTHSTIPLRQILRLRSGQGKLFPRSSFPPLSPSPSRRPAHGAPRLFCLHLTAGPFPSRPVLRRPVLRHSAPDNSDVPLSANI